MVFASSHGAIMTGLPRSQPDSASAKELFEVPDEVLLARAARSALDSNKNKGVAHPRWVAVMDTFVVGSTYAHLICRRFGMDPDEMVKR